MSDDLTAAQSFVLPQGFYPLNWFRGFGRIIGPLYERVEGDSYTRAFMVEEHHANGMHNCHGGMLMAFADMAFGHAVSLHAGDFNWVTVRLMVDFVSAAHIGDWVEGSAELVGRDDDLSTVSGRIWVGSRTVMTGTGIFKTLPMQR